jgi:hypothetical protein
MVMTSLLSIHFVRFVERIKLTGKAEDMDCSSIKWTGEKLKRYLTMLYQLQWLFSIELGSRMITR